MELRKEKTGLKLLVKVSGRIDTNTAGEFGTQINDELEDVNNLTIDFAEVNYVSSVGLRAILELQKIMNTQGQMKIINVKPDIMEIFEMTGFTNILTIE